MVVKNIFRGAVGSRVERLGPVKDPATGRKGSIVEINWHTSRARVKWDERVRTWVNFRFLKLIPKENE